MEKTICLTPGPYFVPNRDAFPNSSYSGAKYANIGRKESFESSIN